MFRSILAVVLGLLTAIAVFAGLFAGLYAIGNVYAPEQFPWPTPEDPRDFRPPGDLWLAATLLVDACAALAAGYVVAWVANRNPMRTVCVLAVIATASVAATAVVEQQLLPMWLSLARIPLFPFCMIAGGALRAQREERWARRIGGL